MTVHKLTAGDGYTYLTRQVASADERRLPGQSLADYYTARGNPPGVWMGAGAATLELAGGPVSEAQMKALFGEGCHPNRDAMLSAGADRSATRLGAGYPSYQALPPLEDRVAEGARVFEHENGRPPTAEEQKLIAAREARRYRRPVAGFDLVFTPVKSASLLWGLGSPEVRQLVEDAHHEALASTIGWLEEHAAFTRTGHGGTAQVDTTGLVCTAFDHRDSRSGDPDLHTHVAVANKVCGVDGKWRSLDARGLHALGVAASERYNTRFEDELVRRLGVGFTERPGNDQGKRPVREVAGVPVALIRHFSKRRAAIEDRYVELIADYRHTHGREPDRSGQLRLAQQATLETREGKDLGRTLSEQVTDWTAQATTVLGRRGLAKMLQAAVGRTTDPTELTSEALGELARQVVRTVSEQRSTWTRWNVYAETERVLRPLRFARAEDREAATEAVVARATGSDLVIRISEPGLVAEPEGLRRASDGESVFVVHGGERFTSSRILDAEELLVDAARSSDATSVDALVAEAALAVHESTSGVRLDYGQRQLVEAFATTSARVALGIGPAGAGKTTAMRAFAAVCAADGRRVVPLASSSRAAQILGQELEMRAENVHKFLHETRQRDHRDHDHSRDGWFQLSTGDVVLVDEASMAGTLQLAELVSHAADAGASVRLLGDPAQLSAVEAGGALRLLETEAGAVHLDHLHRFVDPAEANATLGLRRGDGAALAFYEDHDRIRSGNRDAMLEAAYEGWASDVRAGKTSVLLASTAADVTALNARARTERICAGQVASEGVDLRDGNRAGAGDWVVTRSNVRALTCRRGRDWVKNGDTWTVDRTHRDGSLTVAHLGHGGRVRLPAGYVAESLELAYAATAHRAQGSTVETSHALVTPEMTRESLYVASTRGRAVNTWYTTTEHLLDATSDHEPDPPSTASDVIHGVLARVGGQHSATETIRTTLEEATSLPTLVARYTHARTAAATESLQVAATRALTPPLAAAILNDPAAPRLASVLADTAGRGADPQHVLANAAALDDLNGAHSVARILAARIEDYPTTLGVPATPSTGPGENTGAAPQSRSRPLPWLDSPDVGHPGWRDYLQRRADLITDRATELGSPVAIYRELYRLTALPSGQLGDEPPAGTRRAAAYLAAQPALAEHAPAARADTHNSPPNPRRRSPKPTHPAPPVARPMSTRASGPRLYL